ncbi:S8 family serine peptidase [Kangiella taiwanensis]|uniref:Peptidase S8 n=1 Tax=Kangiella taiwanensis TaxID=1079179 RepID=A0ABP8I576_9GAMM|nr:S8 family serine peptidase [Kangiella taiwanensis]
MKFKPNKVVAALLSTTLITGLSVETAEAAKAKSKQLPEYDPSSIIVKFKSNVDQKSRKQLSQAFGASFKDKNGDGVDDRFRHIAKGRLSKFNLKDGQDPVAMIEQLKHHPDVEYAELNQIYYPSVLPNDPQYSSLWGMQKISAEQGWEMEMGSKDIVVGVIDTGFDYNHPDLQANIWVNPNEIAGNGVDDDGNGYIDDVHGISAINDNGDPQDTGLHGTHVAGTIGAVGNNGVGVTGVSWNTSMVGCSFLGSQGGTLADGIQCIDYMVDLKTRGVNIRVLNNSWGGGGFNQSLKDAITSADNAGMLFIAAAGNDARDNDTSDSFPSNYDVPNVMSIASTTSTDELSSFSQWGANNVDMGAPGSSILSTVPGGYDTLSGTSMATPHVSGAAALVLSADPSLTTAQVKDMLMTSGDPLPALDGITVSGKRLNVESALNMAGAGGPGYYMVPTPSSRTVNQGSPTSFDIDVNPVGGHQGNVTMSASSANLVADITFSANTIPSTGSTVMTVQTSAQTQPGEYTITVTAVDGSISKSTDVQLQVYPEGTYSTTYENNTPVAIPDNSSAGVDSVINVPIGLTITDLTANIDISHTYISDLIVTLTSPSGTTVTLHNREGGSSDNIVASYPLDNYDFEDAMGDWVLNVSDNVGVDTGTLNNWSLDVTGGSSAGTNLPPTVTVNDPMENALYLPGDMVNFLADAVDAEDGDVRSSLVWTSSLDGVIGTGASFSRSDLTQGSHIISVTANDSEGLQSVKEFNLYIVTDGTIVSYEDTQRYPIPSLETVIAEIDVPLGVKIGEMNLFVDIQHSFANDMLIHLVSPNGTTVEIFDQKEQGEYYRDLQKTFYPIEFNGENAAGTWQLRIADEYTNNSGNLYRWVLTFTHDGSGNGNPGNEAPTVAIISPVGGSEFTEGDTVTFTGSANDAEDGDLTGSLVWSSDLDGAIGSGSSVTTNTLSVGTHIVTASASDSASATGEAQVSLVVNPAPVNEVPTSDFNYTVNHLDVAFSDMSGDTDGSVVAWDWNFGDGVSSSLANPAHTYSASGTYSVTLTVTDDQDATHTVTKSVTVSAAIDLSAISTTRNGKVTTDLVWNGGKTSKVDIYRDGVKIREASNNGSYTDRFNSSETNFSYQVCEQGSTTCSAVVTVVALEGQKRGNGNANGKSK